MAKSNHLANQQKFQFKWYLVLILVGVIAVIGISVLYFSQASSLVTYGPATMTGGQPVNGTGEQSNTVVARSLNTAVPVSFSQELPTNTTQTLCVQLSGIPEGGTKLYTSISVSNSKGGSGGSNDRNIATDGWVQLYQNDWKVNFAPEGPTAKLSVVVAGSNSTNTPVSNATVQVRQFAIAQGGTACPIN